MFFKKLLCLATSLACALALAVPTPELEERQAIQTFSWKEIFVPPRNYETPKTLYGRTWRLTDGSLLSTW